MFIFYSPGISSDVYTFNEQESRHCIKVLRLCKGDNVNLIDGKGSFYLAEIINQDPKNCSAKIIRKTKEFEKRNYYCHIVIAPTKNIARFEYFLEKATEIGIDEITPLICERSERKKINKDRLEKIIISAMKQSVKAYLPKMNDIISFNDFLSTKLKGQKFIACYENMPEFSLKTMYTPPKRVNILIGPEGDFSPAEITQANKNEYIGVTLGKSRLRTETAGIVAAHTIALLNN